MLKRKIWCAEAESGPRDAPLSSRVYVEELSLKLVYVQSFSAFEKKVISFAFETANGIKFQISMGPNFKAQF